MAESRNQTRTSCAVWLRVVFAASEVEREREREGSSGEALEIGAISDLVDRRVPLAVPADVRFAVRFGRIRPPVRRLAHVVMLIATRGVTPLSITDMGATVSPRFASFRARSARLGTAALLEANCRARWPHVCRQPSGVAVWQSQVPGSSTPDTSSACSHEAVAGQGQRFCAPRQQLGTHTREPLRNHRGPPDRSDLEADVPLADTAQAAPRCH